MFKSLNTGAIGVRADLAQAVHYATQFGFQGVHVNIQEVATLGARQARDILDAAGIRASAFGVPFDFRIAEPDFAAAVGRLPELSEAARVLGMTRAFTWVPS